MKRASTPWHSAGEILTSRRRRDQSRAGEQESAKRLRTLLLRGERAKRLEHQVQAALPPDLSNHCRVANLINGELRLIAGSSVWATRLRFESPRLKETLQQLSDFRTIDRIKIRAGRIDAASLTGRPQRPASPRLGRLTQIGADCLRACAAELDDGNLKSALTRLSSHLDP